MPTVDVLKEGYSVIERETNVMKANCTCSLIRDREFNIVVDTLTAWDSGYLKKGYNFLSVEVRDSKALFRNTSTERLKQRGGGTILGRCLDVDALEERGLQVEDVTHVVCTHGHSDHVGNLNLFLSAVHIVGQSINSKDIYSLHSFEDNNPYRISEDVEVIATPGHTLSDVSVIVKQSPLGTVAIVGDLFEREEDIHNSDLWEKVAGSENPYLQYKNRNRMLILAEYIIPGHGPGFHVSDDLRKLHQDQEIKFTT